MSFKKRVIARLDIKGPNLVKGIHLEGLRVLGDPAAYARHYYEEGADELFFMDVVASLYERNSLSEIIERIAREIFIPLTVGGGIRTVEDINKVLRAGADKVCINTGAVKNPEIIREASLLFGSSTIAAAIECIKQPNGKYFAFIDNGREETGLEAADWAMRLQELGAGEIVVTSVDREGTGEGFDLELLEIISRKISVPVIAHGGLGSPVDAVNSVQAGVSAIAVASVLHYGALQSGAIVRTNSTTEGNTRFLSEKNSFNKIKPCRIIDIKDELEQAGHRVRKTT